MSRGIGCCMLMLMEMKLICGYRTGYGMEIMKRLFGRCLVVVLELVIRRHFPWLFILVCCRDVGL